jgi:hypothetical protein
MGTAGKRERVGLKQREKSENTVGSEFKERKKE